MVTVPWNMGRSKGDVNLALSDDADTMRGVTRWEPRGQMRARPLLLLLPSRLPWSARSHSSAGRLVVTISITLECSFSLCCWQSSQHYQAWGTWFLSRNALNSIYIHAIQASSDHGRPLGLVVAPDARVDEGEEAVAILARRHRRDHVLRDVSGGRHEHERYAPCLLAGHAKNARGA